jgi:hypothetical protein
VGLYEFNEGSGERFRMNESDASATTAYSWLLINQPGAFRPEVRQRRIDVGDGKRDVVHSLAAGLNESPNGRLRTERLEELDEGTANGDHRFFDTLFGNNLAIHGFGTEEPEVLDKGDIQVPDGQGDVIEVVGEHERKIVQYH